MREEILVWVGNRSVVFEVCGPLLVVLLALFMFCEGRDIGLGR